MAVKAYDNRAEEPEWPLDPPKAMIENEVREATDTEHSLDFLTAVKLYPKAIGWSVFFSLGVIMLAFDPQLVGMNHSHFISLCSYRNVRFSIFVSGCLNQRV